MSLTSLCINGKNVVVITTPMEKVILAQLYEADDTYKPTGNPHYSVDERSEEEYHKALRKDAKEREQYIPSFSTNPEWDISDN